MEWIKALKETFTAKYDGICPEHIEWDQNPKFTTVSETTNIPAPFIGSPPPPYPPVVANSGQRFKDRDLMDALDIVLL